MNPVLIRAALDKGEVECGWSVSSKLEVLLDALDALDLEVMLDALDSFCEPPPCVITAAIENRIKAEKEMPAEG
jgi:hypothetical protein